MMAILEWYPLHFCFICISNSSTVTMYYLCNKTLTVTSLTCLKPCVPNGHKEQSILYRVTGVCQSVTYQTIFICLGYYKKKT